MTEQATARGGGRNPLGFLLLHLYVQFVLCPSHILYGLVTGQANPFALTKHICDRLGVRFYKTKKSVSVVPNPATTKRVIYLCNHRSWADFFCDQVICGGASYLARLLVWVGTPVSSLYGWLSHSTWFFNRKRGIDRAAFAKFMDDEWNKRANFGMIAYPEGTRNQSKDHLPLKTGVLQYAYEYKRCVQCVITANKEAVCNEKEFTMQRNVALITSTSAVIDPSAFSTFEDFVSEVRKVFHDTWVDAYSNKVQECEAYDPPIGHSPPVFAPVCEPMKVTILRLAAVLLAVVIYFYK